MHPNANSSDLMVFHTTDGHIHVHVKMEGDTLWLSLGQLAELFERYKSLISLHLKNIFQEGDHEVQRDIEYYNLDAIISVGYRVNSKRGTQFSQWTSQVLKDHLVQGYSLHKQRLYDQGLNEIHKALGLLSRTLHHQNLMSDVGSKALALVHQYARTWHWLWAYDEKLDIPYGGAPCAYHLEYDTVRQGIRQLKDLLVSRYEASPLFGMERGEYLQGILVSIHQTFRETLLYPSWEERAPIVLCY